MSDKKEKSPTVRTSLSVDLQMLKDEFSVHDFALIFKITERSAQRKIKELLLSHDIVFIRKIGQRNYYKLIKTKQKLRAPFVEYQKQFLDNYIPNKTHCFNRSESTLLLKMVTPNHQVDMETYSVRIYERLIIDLSWASSALEGNTYSLLETEKLILNNQIAEGKNNLETQMILNHKEAIKFLILNKEDLKINSFVINSIHALLSENIIRNKRAQGAIRTIPVGITGTVYVPLAFPQLLEEEFEIFCKKASMIENPIEQSFFILVFISYIQAFEDLNKRTSRVGCNIPFIKNNLIPISFKNVNKDLYVDSLKDVYEFNSLTKLKNIFIKSIKESVKDYTNIVSQLVTPSDVQIKYRNEIKAYVKKCVLDNISPKDIKFMQFEKKIADQILEEVKSELNGLHVGSLIRFGLKLSDFKKWKK
jgi:Fic family protein